MRASARDAPSVWCATELVLLIDALTAAALQGAVEGFAGKLLASCVLLAAGIIEPLCSESLAEGSRLRFLEVGSDDAVTVRNDRLACTAKRNMQLRRGQKRTERRRKRMNKSMHF